MNRVLTKIKMIQASLRCFTFGLLGLLPVIGIPFAIAALVVSATVRPGQRQFWNPAKPYWVIGIICAAAGFIFWTFVTILVVWHVMNPESNGGGGGYYGAGGD